MSDVKQTYDAHGKLLLTAEYFVLQGAKAIALPLQYGQRMDVSEGRQADVVSWKAFMQEGLWFSCDFQLPYLKIIHSSDAEKAVILQDALKAILKMNPQFKLNGGLDIHTKIDFHNQWGLGSSSTLIANLATWAGVDPFQLNEQIFNGSGFDIACASADGPIFYEKDKKPQRIELDYPFLDNLYFIYSGSKKSTRNEVRRFLRDGAVTEAQLSEVNGISEEIANTRDLADFQRLIVQHEALVSGLLNSPTVKSSYFSDFNGEVKSLGAWGGDFYLVATPMDDRCVLKYFKEKGLRVVFPWKELVLNKR
ncbi:GYDIA family GHMP kinase [Sunxiuqinia elliptica]|uniref:Mevalonate kinase n=1 Tax=Sunxiuqinia elliptica TaxID=655355 RepID=A0A1I2EZD5_9BACT|nr:GYDIA family GHMP kinase [Sunxiuqinia elliptica]SFE98235.1 Mevalonate kinase [Sunxiuqinia elliptica]